MDRSLAKQAAAVHPAPSDTTAQRWDQALRTDARKRSTWVASAPARSDN